MVVPKWDAEVSYRMRWMSTLHRPVINREIVEIQNFGLCIFFGQTFLQYLGFYSSAFI